MFMHDAGTKSVDGAPIKDNGGLQVRLDANLSKRQSLFDSLSFEAGLMGSVHRIPSIYSWKTAKEFVASTFASYKWFSFMTNFTKQIRIIFIMEFLFM